LKFFGGQGLSDNRFWILVAIQITMAAAAAAAAAATTTTTTTAFSS